MRPHPHINLATVTYLLEGEILHRDSLGSNQRIRPGAISWMTAGQGITHSERTPPGERGRGRGLHGIQAASHLVELRFQLQRTSLRSRNALIGTSVAAAVGLALVIPAASRQCNSVEIDGKDKYECSRAGDALLGVGSPLVFGGLTGAVVSGIILGVRKGKIRRMNDSFSPSRARAVRWDERSSRLVF